MRNHKVSITIDDQAAVTRVEQTFRNHTNRVLEATYVFPVPHGASVNRFAMWINGKEVKGELVEADKARQIYTSIVRRTQDPGLLEYLGNNLVRMRVFPIPAGGDQKVAVSYTSVAGRQGKLVEYVYPLKANGRTPVRFDGFSLSATIKSQHGIQNVYSPTHAIALKRTSDQYVSVAFERKQPVTGKDFQLLYSLGGKDVGLTTLTHRPLAGEDGYFLMLIAPQLKLAQIGKVPRDLVLVLDTSGSMQGQKIEQARKALKFCLNNLGPKDRFGLIHFATTVNKYRDSLTAGSAEQLAQAGKWVDELQANGGTNIYDALEAALAFRSQDEGRTFTVAFFTDGLPTVGVCDPEKILKDTLAKNTANTRLFTFGVGDDVNATLLDRLAYKTRARPTYVRPNEDIEVKVSSLWTKISHPVLTNLKLSTSGGVRLSEIYPPQLPDLFHGSQLVILGRYSNKGPAAVKLAGAIGKEKKEFVYELTFPEKTDSQKDFVEHLWARRKVGYLLDQIRANGAKKELVSEVTSLAKRYGITTPYTSYLIVPDGGVGKVPQPPRQVPNVGFGGIGGQFGGVGGQFGGIGGQFGGQIGQFGGIGGQFGGQWGQVGQGQFRPTGIGGFGGGGGGRGRPGGGLGGFGGGLAGFGGGGFGQFGQFGLGGGQFGLGGMPAQVPPIKGGLAAPALNALELALVLRQAGWDGKHLAAPPDPKSKDAESVRRVQLYQQALAALAGGQKDALQSGQLGVDLSVELGRLRNLAQLGAPDQRTVGHHVFQRIAGVWIDTAFKEKAPSVVVKAQGDAYFRILERYPKAKDVFLLGNRVVWATPGGVTLVIDTKTGKDKLDAKEIDKLFTIKK
jgi:Ca-activated chloride channel family protein